MLCLWAQVIGEGTAGFATACCRTAAPTSSGSAAPAAVAGPATGRYVVPLAPRTTVVGVRLRPGAAPGLLGPPASALLNRTRRSASCGAPPAMRLGPGQRAASATGEADGGRSGDRSASRRGRPDPMIAAATLWLARHPAGRIADLCRLLEVGERRLRRRFAAAIGYGPKTFQRVLRLQRVLAQAGRLPAAAGLRRSRRRRATPIRRT